MCRAEAFHCSQTQRETLDANSNESRCLREEDGFLSLADSSRTTCFYSRPSSGSLRKCSLFGACVWNKNVQLFLTGETKDKTPLDFHRDFDLDIFFQGSN
ncbi:hypothetical protein SKAU_G00036900 [Synaphobranchus kaupii]|uniref:Uncharacterized protein n=1 Tax=Synaphobranchus kaupii TaxID=118154 RepID=A0A9Q1GFF2_SYNKA|nr:hypothetical protein SKAU_G00036900 [Synaphobranchus kaupii]